MSLYSDENICITLNTMNHRKHIVGNEHSMGFLKQNQTIIETAKQQQQQQNQQFLLRKKSKCKPVIL